MGLEDVLDAFLKGGTRKHGFKSISFGIAESVRETVCDVTRVDDDKLLDVRLQAVEDGITSFVRITPKDGSVVIVGVIDNMEAEACIIQCSEIDEVYIKIGDIELKLSNAGVVFNGGNLKGLVKLEALVSKLNSLEQSLNALKQVFATWTVMPSDGGAALKTAASAWASQAIQSTTNADLENPKIKQ